MEKRLSIALLIMAILFIVVGLFATYFFLPLVKKLYNKNYKKINIINCVLIVVFVLNIIIECII